ncbi:MAG TPA: YkvA family protein [Croceicoccus sp.]|nr:YkvA family protein [Croceicoccus sp.]
MLDRLKGWARQLKRDVIALWLAARDPRVSWGTKLLAGAVAAYALSPIDLIPDFIPVLGLVDDLLIVPAGIWLTVRLVPSTIMADLRERAAAIARPRSRAGLVAVIAVWVALAILAGSLLF